MLYILRDVRVHRRLLNCPIFKTYIFLFILSYGNISINFCHLIVLSIYRMMSHIDNFITILEGYISHHTFSPITPRYEKYRLSTYTILVRISKSVKKILTFVPHYPDFAHHKRNRFIST